MPQLVSVKQPSTLVSDGLNMMGGTSTQLVSVARQWDLNSLNVPTKSIDIGTFVDEQLTTTACCVVTGILSVVSLFQ
jgi:hypothetical protein